METVLASFSQGIFVVGTDGNLIASIGGFHCSGSQDELESVQVVQPFFGRPMIAVTATEGGKSEWVTRLELVAVDGSPQLERLFVGEIQRHDDHGTHSGNVTMFPGALLYDRPNGGISLWPYDTTTSRYTELRTELDPHRHDDDLQ